MTDRIPESKKRSRSPKQIIWDDLPVEQVVRPPGKGHSRQVHPSQHKIMKSYLLEPVEGKPQSFMIALPTRFDPPRIVKELRRLANRHIPKLVLFSQTEGTKVWLWTALASTVEPRARGGRRPRPVLPTPSGNGAKASEPDLAPGVETTPV